MEATAIYESLWYLAGSLLLGGIWYWSLKFALARDRRAAQGSIAQPQHQSQHQSQPQQSKTSCPEQLDSETGLYTFPFFIEQLDDYFHRAQAPIREQKEIVLIKLVDLEAMESSFGFARTDMIVHKLAQQLHELTEVNALTKTHTNAMASYAGRGLFAVFIDPGHTSDLLKQLDQPYTGLRISLVAGSALWPEQGRSTSKLMRHAETALLVSVAQHKTWLAYEPEMEPSHLDLEIIARFAEGNVQGLYPVFQPQLNLHTGKIESAEALVRWHCTRMGDIPPVAFIPLLEMAGLIGQVTCMMIDKAVQVSAELRQRNLVCAISVNVTRYDLIHTSMVEFIRLVLERHHGHASDLRLECAENFMTGDLHKLKKVLGELDDLGIAIALDNLGAGDFSLVNLSQLPITDLHINRHFVGDMLINLQHEKIVRTALALARELELRVLAEGIEDDKTLQLLKAEACDLAQGYVIARPMDETRFIEFMQTHGVEGFDVS